MTTSRKKKKVNGRRKGTPSMSSQTNDDDGTGRHAKPSSMPPTNDDGVNELFGNLNIAVDEISSSSRVAHQCCSACGKESNHLKTCGGCNLVKYCDATCQMNHRPQHKDECKTIAAKLFDEVLFNTPILPREECPVCFLPHGFANDECYLPCCGKNLCAGCMYSLGVVGTSTLSCPFCRSIEFGTWRDGKSLLDKKVKANDARSMHLVAYYHSVGENGYPFDPRKAIELWSKAASLGNMDAHYWLGNSYYTGDNNVVKSIKRGLHHWGQAAILGDVSSRFSLGSHEAKVTGNMERAVKHWSIAASAGQKKALDDLKELYMKGYMTKAEFEVVLRAHKDSADGMNSEQRTKASAFNIGAGFRSSDGVYRNKSSGGTCNCVDCMMGRNA